MVIVEIYMGHVNVSIEESFHAPGFVASCTCGWVAKDSSYDASFASALHHATFAEEVLIR